jgi:DNA-binding protein HU-beta
MMTMTTNETITKEKISAELKAHLGLSVAICSKIVDSIFEEITRLTKLNQELTIRGFGKFYINQKNARPGFNIKQKTSVTIPARSVLRFIPSRSFKNMINKKSQ